MTTDVSALDALSVLADLADASPDERYAAQSELTAHFARLSGVTDQDLKRMTGVVPGHILATARGNLAHGALSPLAVSALRLACDEPRLAEMHPRTRRRMASGYLSDLDATITATKETP